MAHKVGKEHNQAPKVYFETVNDQQKTQFQNQKGRESALVWLAQI